MKLLRPIPTWSMIDSFFVNIYFVDNVKKLSSDRYLACSRVILLALFMAEQLFMLTPILTSKFFTFLLDVLILSNRL